MSENFDVDFIYLCNYNILRKYEKILRNFKNYLLSFASFKKNLL